MTVDEAMVYHEKQLLKECGLDSNSVEFQRLLANGSQNPRLRALQNIFYDKIPPDARVGRKNRQSVEEPFQCTLCPRQFAHRRSFYAHRMKKHPSLVRSVFFVL